MPLVQVYTSTKRGDLKAGVEERIARAVAGALGKPMEKMIVLVHPDQTIFRLGNTDPACIVEIKAIAVFDKDRNPTYAPPIKKALHDEFSIPEERIGLTYFDLDPAFIG